MISRVRFFVFPVYFERRRAQTSADSRHTGPGTHASVVAARRPPVIHQGLFVVEWDRLQPP